MASFGENLRRERELRGIDLRDIADATKISVRFLQALEQDRLDILPGGIFRRAFVRQYARYVGLDPERLVAEFIYANGDDGAERPAAAAAPAARWAVPRGGLAVLGVLGAAGLLLLLRPSAERTGREASVATTVPPPARPADRVYPPPSLLQAAAQQSEGLVLSISARQSCWVAIRVDGQTVVDQVLAEGETRKVEATGEIVLSVGNAGGLVFTLNNRPGLPLGRSGEVRKNIVITRQSLPSLVQESEPPSLTPHS
jgi:cytoskeletal protein RodZ